MPVERRDLLLVTLLAALLFLPGLGRRDVWNPDEARYAQVAREMREGGSWALPHLNGERYTQKPPLFFWAIALSSALTGGVDETSARLPSALAAVAACALVFRIGQRLFGRRAAWLAVAAFATCFKILWQGRFGQIDMTLTALVALAMWWFVRGYTEKRQGFYWLFFATGGLATLAKGPAGLLPPLFGIVAFLLLSGERHEVGRLRIGRGLLLWAVVVLAWLVPAGLAGGREYLDQIVFKQNVGRYADPWHHFRPWYYFLTTVPADFFPWSFLLPLVVAVRDGYSAAARRGVRFAACWAIANLVFFSLSPAKRSVYVLTMFPALALLVGVALDTLAASWPSRRRWLGVPLWALSALAALAVVAVFVAAPRRELELLGGMAILVPVVAAFVLLLGGAVAAAVLARRGRVSASAAALAAGMAGMWLVVALAVLPRFDVVKSARGMSREVVARLPAGATYGIYPRLDSTLLFYTRRFAVPVDSPEALAAFLARPEPVLLLAQRDDWARLAAPPPLVTLATDPDDREGYLLLARPQDVAALGGAPLSPATAAAE